MIECPKIRQFAACHRFATDRHCVWVQSPVADCTIQSTQRVSRDCTIQSAEKVFFKRLYDTMGRKSFFQAIVRYNWPKKFFSSDCTIQLAEKVFFKRLYDTIGRKGLSRLYDTIGPKGLSRLYDTILQEDVRAYLLICIGSDAARGRGEEKGGGVGIKI